MDHKSTRVDCSFLATGYKVALMQHMCDLFRRNAASTLQLFQTACVLTFLSAISGFARAPVNSIPSRDSFSKTFSVWEQKLSHELGMRHYDVYNSTTYWVGF
uniref:Uncharacterized protein n=1 Tax=Peronospora matthiolae TaxID=2874970 RepID=A0AAV1TY42_9STRA